MSIFQTIWKEKIRRKTSIFLILIGLFLAISITFVIVGRIAGQRNAHVVKEKDEIISQLQSEINSMKSTIIAETDLENTQISTEGSFVYTIRKGDSFWRISECVYGTGRFYKELAADNDLDIDSHLVVGQKLIIKNR